MIAILFAVCLAVFAFAAPLPSPGNYWHLEITGESFFLFVSSFFFLTRISERYATASRPTCHEEGVEHSDCVPRVFPRPGPEFSGQQVGSLVQRHRFSTDDDHESAPPNLQGARLRHRERPSHYVVRLGGPDVQLGFRRGGSDVPALGTPRHDLRQIPGFEPAGPFHDDVLRVLPAEYQHPGVAVRRPWHSVGQILDVCHSLAH